MSNENKISIVIPTIGSGPLEYLKDSLESAKSIITHPLLDVVYIIDNSNSEQLNQLISSYVNLNSKFKHIKISEKMNMAQCWNKGLSLVSSKWLLYLHDDDIINCEDFMKIDDSEVNQEVGYIAFDFHKLSNGHSSYVSIKNGIEGIIHNTPKFISTIYSTEKLKSIGGWDENAGYALDLLALVKLCHQYSDRKINRSLGQYRIHEQNSSSLDKRSKSYGDAIPYILGELFSLIENPKVRRILCFHLISFTYPNDSLFKKVINTFLRIFRIKGWMINY